MRHCLQCGQQDCRVCEYLDQPDDSLCLGCKLPLSGGGYCVVCSNNRLTNQMERELRATIEMNERVGRCASRRSAAVPAEPLRVSALRAAAAIARGAA